MNLTTEEVETLKHDIVKCVTHDSSPTTYLKDKDMEYWTKNVTNSYWDFYILSFI